MGDDLACTQLHPARALLRSNRYNSDNTDEMDGSKLGISVNELCPDIAPTTFRETAGTMGLALLHTSNLVFSCA